MECDKPFHTGQNIELKMDSFQGKISHPIVEFYTMNHHGLSVCSLFHHAIVKGFLTHYIRSMKRIELTRNLMRIRFDDTEFLHSVSEGVTADVKKSRCPCLVSLGHLKGLSHKGFLYLF